MKLWLWSMKLGATTGCHQKPERSFFINGYQFPVCARCTGILLGYIASFVLLGRIEINYWMCILLLLPMAIDGLSQLKGKRESTQFLRVTTGFLGGIGILTFQLNLLFEIIF